MGAGSYFNSSRLIHQSPTTLLDALGVIARLEAENSQLRAADPSDKFYIEYDVFYEGGDLVQTPYLSIEAAVAGWFKQNRAWDRLYVVRAHRNILTRVAEVFAVDSWVLLDEGEAQP